MLAAQRAEGASDFVDSSLAALTIAWRRPSCVRAYVLSLDLRIVYVNESWRRFARENGAPVTYECSSASRFRKLNMRVDLTPSRDGFVVVHSMVADAVLERAGAAIANYAALTNASGLIVQCSNCRRTRRADDGHSWVWVPELVAAPPDNFSHGLCPSCDALYYWVAPVGTG